MLPKSKTKESIMNIVLIFSIYITNKQIYQILCIQSFDSWIFFFQLENIDMRRRGQVYIWLYLNQNCRSASVFGFFGDKLSLVCASFPQFLLIDIKERKIIRL